MKKGIRVRICIAIVIVGSILAISNTIVSDYKKGCENEKTKLFIQNMNNRNLDIKHSTIKDKYNDYIAVLEIPKIGLRKGLFSPESINNNVNKSVAILSLQMPDEKNSIFILASHSGTSNVSYFNNLDKLRYKDKVYVYYKNVKYKYMIYNYYEEKKTGKLVLKSNSNKSTIVLTTCKPISFNKQLVYIGYLYDAEVL